MSQLGYQSARNFNNSNPLRDRLRNFSLRHGLLPRERIDSIISLFTRLKAATTPFEVDEWLDPGKEYRLGEKHFHVIPTPGHTRGHVCFFFQEDRFLLSGDHLLPDITPHLGPDLFARDFRPLASFLESLDTIQALPVAQVYPGHGAPFSHLKERVEEIKGHHHKRKKSILESVRGARKTAYQVAQDIFGRALPDFDGFLALCETYVHLMELEREGLVLHRKAGKRNLFSVT